MRLAFSSDTPGCRRFYGEDLWRSHGHCMFLGLQNFTVLWGLGLWLRVGLWLCRVLVWIML